MQRILVVFAISAWLGVPVCSGQAPESNSTVMVREIRFIGEPGGAHRELVEYTNFLVGHSMEEKAVLKESASAVTAFFHHRGFLKARVTAALHPATTFGTAKQRAVVLVVNIETGKRYRIQDVEFAGLLQQTDETELRQACTLRTGDVADDEDVGNCVANLKGLFHQRGSEVTVIPATIFDEERSTVVFRFDVEK